jgi:hypothetical protein
LFKGTPRAVPDSSPRASVGLPLRLPQVLEPTNRTFFPHLTMQGTAHAAEAPTVAPEHLWVCH